MKKEGNSQAVKVIGKNCKWNMWYNLNRSKTYCFHTMKTCGQNHTCDCYNTAGKLQFQVKEETNDK